ncbi:cytochrome c [Methylobacterium sp. WL6]|uniref:SorB family sulfite dehydrogenase c-type cytochrome subunit n=1 Tax=Methylobacterium sp. WL6 TaxID=2603901 RepID=UPI0011C8C302|nr:cytochrome c [Methylobacterium sp. WL6]TXN70478.1 cytochrome c [Methylobacterium sp. WL6]
MILIPVCLRTTQALALATTLSLASAGASAAPRNYELPEPTAQLRAPKDPAHRAGFEAAQGNCMACHSVDYVAMQPPGKGATFWETEVTKMRKVYHAPVDEADGRAIAAYLAATY